MKKEKITLMSDLFYFFLHLKGTVLRIIANRHFSDFERGGIELLEEHIFSSSPNVKWYPRGVTRGG